MSGNAAQSRTARTNFRSPATTAGFVDAGWWPRTDDLVAELPGLLEPLWAQGHTTNRVAFHIGSWQPAPRRVTIGDRVVRLGGFHTADPLTAALSDGNGERIDVLVIATGTDSRVAARALELAATNDTDRAARILELAR